MGLRGLLTAAALAALVPALGLAQPRLAPAPETAARTPLPALAGGRVVAGPEGWTYQWPSARFEAAFAGEAVLFKVGAGDQILHLSIDGSPVGRLIKPAPGLYRIEGLANGRHLVAASVVNEMQAAPARFGGFFLDGGRPLPLAAPRRQIEFIGDSHSVGYGDASEVRACPGDGVWMTTDNSIAFGPLTAQRFGAERQVNAISGRGIVRNFDGMAGDTLPLAWPKALLGAAPAYANDDWRPQVVVINLGTNDFSTPLKPGEPWKDRQALRDDYVATYARFVRDIRARQPQAFVILLAPPSADSEIAAQVDRVAETLTAGGETRLAVIPVGEMELTGCDWHPSARDQQGISDKLSAFLAQRPEIWQGR
ncbi:SGNH/GDSL hydrolase family protein [Caulobacter endophyticus]|uniref:SGNH/GDSL hydrolase family protein n=1 Tax=Caulobacter endophyticus TaxID=2172652 RepID=UPI00240F5B37|nr:SGNH/GDSL hydrolase family protein [Caulobacter endophyticus]MDG2531158.1 GDSL-type esterase/lipase family protein [Caulobacter endophyticus]